MTTTARPAALFTDPDLATGVVPVSYAAAHLAALLKLARETGRPVAITQKGFPTGVLLPVNLFATLKALAEGSDAPAGDLPGWLLDGPDAEA